MRVFRFLIGALVALTVSIPLVAAAQELKVGLALEPT